MKNEHLVMEADLNSNNTLFGGKLLSWVDESAAIWASKQFKCSNIVTVFMDRVHFKHPAYKNEIVRITGAVKKSIKPNGSSITLTIKAEVINVRSEVEHEILETNVVFVDLDRKALKDSTIFCGVKDSL